MSGIAFATQNTDFQTSTEDDYDPRVEKLKCPTQLLFASSMNDTECLFFKKFQDYALKMFMGDKRYFVTSMPCDLALHPHMDGKPFTPLLKQSQIDDEMRVNQAKALREYYNKPTAESEDQMIRSSTIIRNSTFLLPELKNEDNRSRYILACDPARVGDGSIIAAMKICQDDKVGIYGKIVNCTDMIDLGKKKKMSVKQPDQIKMIHANILAYNGVKVPDYENIEEFLMDAGSGGGASGYADNMLDTWLDQDGIPHKGFIDDTHDTYKEDGINYPDASRKFKLINPKKYRMQMCEELLELVSLDLIKFPKEYNGKDYILVEETNENGEVDIVERKLSIEERVALINIDAMKSELLGIHIFRDKVGNVTSYANPNQHAKDDRFYTLLLLAHKLYEIRRKNMLKVDTDPYEDSQLVWY